MRGLPAMNCPVGGGHPHRGGVHELLDDISDVCTLEDSDRPAQEVPGCRADGLDRPREAKRCWAFLAEHVRAAAGDLESVLEPCARIQQEPASVKWPRSDHDHVRPDTLSKSSSPAPVDEPQPFGGAARCCALQLAFSEGRAPPAAIR
jgi:hypothetical protein